MKKGECIITEYQACQILKIYSDYSINEINHSYKKLIKKYHPDVNKSIEAEHMSKLLNIARECLIEICKKRKTVQYSTRSNTNNSRSNKDNNESTIKNQKYKNTEKNNSKINYSYLLKHTYLYLVNDISKKYNLHPSLKKSISNIMLIISDFDRKQGDKDNYINACTEIKKIIMQYISDFCNLYGLRYLDNNDYVIVENEHQISLNQNIIDIHNNICRIFYNKYISNITDKLKERCLNWKNIADKSTYEELHKEITEAYCILSSWNRNICNVLLTISKVDYINVEDLIRKAAAIYSQLNINDRVAKMILQYCEENKLNVKIVGPTIFKINNEYQICIEDNLSSIFDKLEYISKNSYPNNNDSILHQIKNSIRRIRNNNK